MALPAEQPALSTRKIAWQKTAKRARVPLGLVVAVLVLLLARPTWTSLAASLPLVLAGLGLRAASAGYLTKNKRLATTGPYAYVRNPLYLGTALLSLGFAVASLNLVVGLSVVLMLLAIYLPTIAAEERYLHKKFPDFDAYRQAVPCMLPRLTPARLEGEGSFSLATYVKNREYQALMGSIAIFAFLIARVTR